jgi:hypothetical protein
LKAKEAGKKTIEKPKAELVIKLKKLVIKQRKFDKQLY